MEAKFGLCYDVMFELYVRFCSAMSLVLHSPQQDQDFKWGGQVQLSCG